MPSSYSRTLPDDKPSLVVDTVLVWQVEEGINSAHLLPAQVYRVGQEYRWGAWPVQRAGPVRGFRTLRFRFINIFFIILLLNIEHWTFELKLLYFMNLRKPRINLIIIGSKDNIHIYMQAGRNLLPIKLVAGASYLNLFNREEKELCSVLTWTHCIGSRLIDEYILKRRSGGKLCPSFRSAKFSTNSCTKVNKYKG